ncbi:MAG: hypothetical protein Tsb0014_10580 [Pleurocapsa sp.]
MFTQIPLLSNCTKLNYLREKNCGSIPLDCYYKPFQKLYWSIKNFGTNCDRAMFGIEPHKIIVDLIVRVAYPLLDLLVFEQSTSAKTLLLFKDTHVWFET